MLQTFPFDVIGCLQFGNYIVYLLLKKINTVFQQFLKAPSNYAVTVRVVSSKQKAKQRNCRGKIDLSIQGGLSCFSALDLGRMDIVVFCLKLKFFTYV